MSKSLGNFYTLRDVIEKGYSGREARYALLRVHYRAQLNFTWEGMEEARTALARIDDWVARLRAKAAESGGANDSSPAVASTFEDALDDDLNISAALGFLFETIRETNRALDQGNLDAAHARAWLQWWQKSIACSRSRRTKSGPPAEVTALAEARAQARLAKEWRKSDELRDQLAALGWEVRDTKDGQKITKRGGV
jgi:cysteinyl-tRNA synthetase